MTGINRTHDLALTVSNRDLDSSPFSLAKTARLVYFNPRMEGRVSLLA